MPKTKGCVLDVARQRGGAMPGVVTLVDHSRYRNDGAMTDVTWTQLPSGLWVLDFNGTSSIVDYGNTHTNIKSALLWIYPNDNTSRSIIDFDGGTHSLELSAGGDLTATGWAAPTIYVNGIVAAAVSQSNWSCIAVTTATAFSASALVFGQEASFFDGKMGIIVLHDYVLSAGQILKRVEATRHLFGV